jgi:hypothetical protein
MSETAANKILARPALGQSCDSGVAEPAAQTA